jgi:single-stranded-DNA-specific exonuclease
MIIPSNPAGLSSGSSLNSYNNPMTSPRRWIEPEPIDPPQEILEIVGGDPLVAGLLARRGIITAAAAQAFLDPVHYVPTAGTAIPDLREAATRLEAAIAARKNICVWGDFDVDGQTATTLLVEALQELGGRVKFHIPVRATESHGVNPPVLTKLINQGMDLLLTCDTGIAAHEAVDRANARGVEVIITDHHDLAPTLPAAAAVVNPKRLPAGHPLQTLPGVGVAYKLVEELFRRAGRAEASDGYLDLVALGIVADLAAQVGDTRYLLQRGLEVLRNTRRLGLQAMMELAGIQPAWLTEEQISFGLAPRLNALGRLADANPSVEFFTTQDLSRARILAEQLEGLNAQRKLLSDQVFQGALSQIERDPTLLDHAALVLANPSWPAGVIGIVANKLVERYQKPTLLLTNPPGELARGSARSVEGCNITAAIAAHREMLAGFGGHPMAAGLSLDGERIEAFRLALSATVAEMLGVARPEPTLQIDGYLALEDLSLDLVEALERLAPFGPGNAPLTFASRSLTLKSQRQLGRTGDHLQVVVQDEQEVSQRLVWWGGSGWPLPEGRFDLAYNLRVNSFRGQRELQVQWVEARPIDPPDHELALEKPDIEVFDHRSEMHPLAVLQKISAEGDIQVWAEGEARGKLHGRDRNELAQGPALAIWTPPPDWRVLQNTLSTVSPRQVYLFAVDPGSDRPEAFLKRLAGLVKHSLNARSGQTSISALAAATAQTEGAVQLGLGWMAGKGMIRIIGQEEGVLQLAEGSRKQGEVAEITAALKHILQETAAYRQHYARADGERLINGGQQP